MAPCKKITLQRRTKKHPSGVVSRKKCLIGKELQKLDAVKAWSKALREVVGFKKGEFAKIPKKGSVKYKAVKARMRQLMGASTKRAPTKRAAPKPVARRRSARLAKK